MDIPMLAHIVLALKQILIFLHYNINEAIFILVYKIHVMNSPHDNPRYKANFFQRSSNRTFGIYALFYRDSIQ